MPDVLVTGLPRSGSTLGAGLIDGLPNSICFNSPSRHLDLVHQAADIVSYGKLLAGDFLWLRAHAVGKQPFDDIRAGTRLGATLSPATLSGDFILGAKHHTLYTSALPTLVEFRHFKIIAVIRHPLEVFAAWKQLPQPLLARGRPMGIARFWPEALAIASSGADMATLFVQLYDAYLQRYHELREHIHIVKYEDIIQDPMIVSRILGLKILPASASLIQEDARPHFASSELEAFRSALKQYGVFAKLYYKDT